MRLLIQIVGIVLVLAGLALHGAYRTVTPFLKTDSAVFEAMEEVPVTPPDGPTKADAVLFHLVEILEALLPPDVQDDAGLWGFWKGRMFPTPSEEAALSQVNHWLPLWSDMIASVSPSLETEGTEALLERTHMYKDMVVLSSWLSEVVVSLFRLGRDEEAIGLLRASYRLFRICARGIHGGDRSLTRTMALQSRARLDRAVAEAIRRHFVLEAKLGELQALIEENRDREIGFEAVIADEMARLGRTVESVDRRLGIHGLPMRLWWGRGAVQLEQLEEDRKAGRPPPPTEELQRMHPAIRVCYPNVASATKQLLERNAAQLGVLVAMRLEREYQATGRYPEKMAEGLVDPTSGKPWILRSKADQMLFYGMGFDGADDGADRGKDIVIWGEIAPPDGP